LKWYKHMSDMSNDVRVKRLIREYGVEGYGIYNYVLELVVRRLDEDSPLPDLEESSNDIASDMGMDTVVVEKIMWFCIQQGLFEQDEVSGRILASKIYKFLEGGQTRSERLKAMIKAYKAGNSVSQTVSDSLGLSEREENRLEEKRREEKRENGGIAKVKHPTYSLPIGETRWKNITRKYGESVCNEYLERIMLWEDEKKDGKRQYKDYAAACEKWMRKDNVPQKVSPTANRCPECNALLVDGICFNCEESNNATAS